MLSEYLLLIGCKISLGRRDRLQNRFAINSLDFRRLPGPNSGW